MLRIIDLQRENIRRVLLISSLLFIWSTAYLCIEISLFQFSVANLAFLRYLIASIVFAIAGCFVHIRLPAPRHIVPIFVMGTFGTAFYALLLNYGQSSTSPGVASILISTNPFFVSLIAAVKGDERITASGLLALTFGFLGVVLIMIKDTGEFTINIASLAVVAAAICMAVFLVMQKRFIKDYLPIEIASYSIWSGTLILSFFADQPLDEFFGSDELPRWSIIYLGVIPGFGAYLILGKLIAIYKASITASLLFLVPVITIIISWITLKEFPDLTTLTGAAMILVGVGMKTAT